MPMNLEPEERWPTPDNLWRELPQGETPRPLRTAPVYDLMRAEVCKAFGVPRHMLGVTRREPWRFKCEWQPGNPGEFSRALASFLALEEREASSTGSDIGYCRDVELRGVWL